MPDWFPDALQSVLDFSTVLNASISACWLILVVMVLRFALKKTPKWIHVALWGIVALRLLMPFSIESAFSLIPSAETVSDQLLQAGPVPGAESAYLEIITNPSYGSVVTVELDQTISSFQWDIMLMVIPWMIGMALMVLYTAVSYWRLRKKVDTAVILRDNIFQSENVTSPFVLGILKPRIYLPFQMCGQDLAHVIAHEQAHLRRKDHWWKPLGFLLLTVHWFNPLMWLAYILLCRDIELACDEKVIKELGNEQRAGYTQALVACSVNRRMITACPLAFGEVGVKERVKNVMNYKRPAFWVIVIAVVICIAVAVCFLTNPKQDSFDIRIVIPAGSTEAFVYSHEEVSPTGNQIIITAGENLGDTEVVLMPVEEAQWEYAYEPTYLTPGMPVKMTAERGAWFKIGVNIQNPADEDIEVYVNVQHVEVRISDHQESQNPILEAKILEIHENYFLVRPVEGSWELNSADKIEVSMKNMDASPEPRVGDTLRIEYDGQILETYPARIHEVYRISVIGQAEQTVRMINCNGIIYIDTGEAIPAEIDPSAILGTLHTQVEGRPANHGQGNFACEGCQYAWVERDIAVLIDNEWYRFTEEVLTSPEYYLTIGEEGAVFIETRTGARVELICKEDMSAYERGEAVLLPVLTGKENLRGVTITVRDADNNDIFSVSISAKEHGKADGVIECGDWIITPVTSEEERNALIVDKNASNNIEIANPDWGITLTMEDVTPSGGTIVCTQSGGAQTGELFAGDAYLLYGEENGVYGQLQPITVATESNRKAVALVMDGDTKWTVDWSDLYGELPPGQYTIFWIVSNYRNDSDYDNELFEASFVIE